MKNIKHLLFLSILCSLVLFTNCGDSDDPVADTPTNTTDDSTDDDSNTVLDADGDGVADDVDTCADTPSGETVDSSGCADSQKDTDGDGVTDDLDTCTDTPSGEMVDLNGCIKYILPLNIEIETLDEVIILGNSITYSSENPTIGWYGNWGMAASSQENDYIHLLEKKLTALNTSIKIKSYNISKFEHQLLEFNFGELDTLFNDKKSLVIVNLGENFNEPSTQIEFRTAFSNLISYVEEKDISHILVVNSFWTKSINIDIREIAINKDIGFASITDISSDTTNMAYSFEHTGIRIHPGDNGMDKIAERILSALNL